jgi:glyoxylase-like metal-dependent hydrolase (beta-lactamase superfamily II)
VPAPDSRLTQLVDGSEVDLGDRRLDAYEAPGHAPHQLVFHDDAAEAVFAADAAGIYVPRMERIEPTSPPADLDFEGCIEDVRLLQRMGPETICYGHFGPVPAGDRLVEYADTLTDRVEAIAEARIDPADDEAVVGRTGMDAVWSERKAHAETRVNVRGVLGYLDRREAGTA